MNSDLKVEIQSEPSSSIQFGKNSDYRTPKTINRTHLKVAGGIFGVLVIFAVLSGPPEEPLSNSKESEIKPPDYVSSSPQSKALDLETYEENFKRPKSPKPGAKSKKQFSGPESLTRQDKIFFEPGTAIKAQIVSGGSLGFVKAKLSEELSNTPLKSGTLLIGKAEATDDRILVHFTKAIVDNKESYAINAEVADLESKESGIAISLWDRYARKFGMSAGLYILSGAADTLQDRDTVGGQVVVKPTLGNAALGGIKTSTLETAHDVLNDQKNKQSKPNLKINLPVLIVFDGEIEPAK